MAKKHVLIVDDSDVIRRVTRSMLWALQFDASEVESGHAAIARCGETMPDVILLDWCMPALSGLESLRSLRRLPGGAAPVVIYCTTENDADDFERARQAGANGVIVKPFDREALRCKLVEVGLI